MTFTITPAQLITEAGGLLGDGNSRYIEDNPEYTRAIVELTQRLLGYTDDAKDAVLKLITPVTTWAPKPATAQEDTP